MPFKKKSYPQKKYLIITKEKISLLLIIFVFLTTLYFLWQSDFFRIQEINCQINQSPCSPHLEEIFSILLQENIFTLDSKAKVKAIKSNYPDWQTLKITPRLPHQVQIMIETLQPIAVLTKEGEASFYLINRLGSLVAKKETNPGFPLIMIEELPQADVGQLLSVSFLSSSLELIELLTEAKLNFKNLKIKEGGIIVYFDTFLAVFSPEKDLRKQVASLQLITNAGRINQDHFQEVDLRFEKPVIREFK